VFFGKNLLHRARTLELNWFLHDFGSDPELLSRDQIDEKALLNLRGIVRTTCTRLNGHSYQNLEAFAPAAEWEALPHEQGIDLASMDAAMTFSYSQIAHYLRCPRSYRHHYLEGWREKETRAAMPFGRRVRIAAQLSSANGILTAAPHWNLRMTRPGIACSIKESYCWSASLATTGSTFLSRNRTFRSKLCTIFQTKSVRCL
jgi:PD-(D/E)XK nuclease superfamily